MVVCTEATTKCVRAKVAEALPPAILTDPGTVAALGFELLRTTVSPDAGVGPEKTTVPVTVATDPPMTAVGESDTPCKLAG